MDVRCQEITNAVLQAYLERQISTSFQEALKYHLDSCPPCHSRWNRFRWEQAKGTPGYIEFETYLRARGEPLLEYLDSSRALIEEWRRLAPQSAEEREAFFRQTPYYLYNLVIWHESKHRPPYVASALPLLRELRVRTICDFGCGIGTDGLRFLDEGYAVIFCEYDNPSSRFLRWRLQQRQREAHWIEPAELAGSGLFDTLWAIDVLDHLPDFHALIPLLKRCRVACFENDSFQKTHGGASFHIHRAMHVLPRLLTEYGFRLVHTGPLLALWQKAYPPC
jgi:SAM-dependent methyltransferase